MRAAKEKEMRKILNSLRVRLNNDNKRRRLDAHNTVLKRFLQEEEDLEEAYQRQLQEQQRAQAEASGAAEVSV